MFSSRLHPFTHYAYPPRPAPPRPALTAGVFLYPHPSSLAPSTTETLSVLRVASPLFQKLILHSGRNGRWRQEKAPERFRGFAVSDGFSMAGAEGLEPSTYGFGDRRSTN